MDHEGRNLQRERLRGGQDRCRRGRGLKEDELMAQGRRVEVLKRGEGPAGPQRRE